MNALFLLHALTAAFPLPAANLDSGAVRTDSAVRDTAARRPGRDSLARRDSLPPRTWTVRLGGSVGAQFPTFPQRRRFRDDVAKVVARDSLVLQQPFQSSELGPLLGLEASLQWKEAVRLVGEGQWAAWWNQARAGKGTRVRNWSSSVQVWRLGAGPDLLVSPKVFSIQGMGPLALEARGWLVRSELVGRAASRGWGSGWSAGLASSVRATRRFELGGRIRWHQELVSGRDRWDRLLENDSLQASPRWATGGLAIGLWSTFDLGW